MPLKSKLAGSAGLLIFAAGAQAASQANDPAGDDFQIDEIIITAQKRAQSQQDVPIAVTAFSNNFIVENNVRTLEDLAAVAPGFVTTNTVGYGAAPLTIRGIGGANGGGNFFADEPVAVYVDDAYIGRLSVSTADLLDLEAIEVLRGPQGTLYGRNSTAGAVLVRTKRPTDTVEGYVQASYASFDEFRAQGAVSGPLIEDRVLARLAVGYSDRPGWGTNTVDGSDIGGSEDLTVRGSIRLTPDENLTLDLIGDYSDREANPATLAVADISDPSAISPFRKRPDFDQVLDDREFAINDPTFLNSETWGVTLLADWDLGGVTLNSVTSFRSYEFDGAQDSDSTALRLLNNDGTTDNEQFSQEIRLSSNGDGPFSWVVGGFYFSEDNQFGFNIRNFGALFGLGTFAQFEAAQDLESYALFADMTYAFSDTVSLTVGGRYSDETKDFNNSLLVTILNGGTLPPFSPVLPGVTLPPGTVFTPFTAFADEGNFDDFSPRVVLNITPNDDILLYASYSQGFTSGGFNVFGLAPEFDSQELDAFEVGLKSDLLDRRVRLNVSAYYNDFTNLQLRLPVPTGGVDIANAASAEIYGLELETIIVPADGWRISGNLALMEATFEGGQVPAVPGGVNFPFGAPIPLVPVSIDGNRLSRAPDLQGNIAVDYTHAFGNGDTLAARAMLRYQDEVFFLETNQDADTFKSEELVEVDIRLSYSLTDMGMDIAVFGQNIFDNRTLTQVTALGALPNGVVNDPARWGVQLTKSF